jgi:Mn2+/Fe2+ NRAMP family transporter
VDRRFREAPIFYWLYTGLIVIGASFVLIPNLPLIKLLLYSQVANGILLPFVLTVMLKLVNKQHLMGAMRNGRWANAIAATTSVIMVALTAVMIWQAITG